MLTFTRLLVEHGIVLGFFYLIYLYLFLSDRDRNFHIRDKNVDMFDIILYTTATHSTTGMADITPKSSIAKIVTSIHQIVAVVLAISQIRTI
jgi:hypothetical protein